MPYLGTLYPVKRAHQNPTADTCVRAWRRGNSVPEHRHLFSCFRFHVFRGTSSGSAYNRETSILDRDVWHPFEREIESLFSSLPKSTTGGESHSRSHPLAFSLLPRVALKRTTDQWQLLYFFFSRFFISEQASWVRGFAGVIGIFLSCVIQPPVGPTLARSAKKFSHTRGSFPFLIRKDYLVGIISVGRYKITYRYDMHRANMKLKWFCWLGYN